jgi:deoxyribodipyrimidine photo-lyase
MLRKLVQESGAGAVYWSRRYEPAVIARDAEVKDALHAEGVDAQSYNVALLHEPWTIKNQSGRAFQVFTPFWKHCLAKDDPPAPLAAPKRLPAPASWPKSVRLDSLNLLPAIKWDTGISAAWQPGEAGATECMKRFFADAFDSYTTGRNRPDLRGTSRLSPYLHFGEISPRQIWHALGRMAAKHSLPLAHWRGSQFLAELGWREFAHHLLYHFPHTPTEPLRGEFAAFPWARHQAALRAWQKGQTGFPIVDAAMRELWTTGWMHNRARMIVASFLVKDLLIPWQEGARWFWNTLVDADLAQNTLGWQWTSGCGADAAPYFRVFNPTTQGQKFDPDGEYVRRWVPELAKLPTKWIHQPEAGPPEILLHSGIKLGRTYPAPIVSHSMARNAALAAYERIKRQKAT